MEAKNLSAENMFVDKIEWNGAPYNRNFITYDEIMNGGNLVFHMSSTPKK
jgi:putative alpha-1,2-mannosidase